MNEIYTEADLIPESTIPSGAIVTEKDLLPVGAVPPTMRDVVAEPAKEPIAMSAVKDLGNVAGGINKMVGQGVMDWVNVLNPSKQNTLYRFAKGIKEEYDKGQLSEDAWNTAKSFVMPVLEDLAAVSGDIVSGEPGKAVEKIARRPFTYAMDIASIAQPIKSGAKYGASVTFGPSAENISARIANSKVIQNARPYEQIAADIPMAMKDIDSKITQADNLAWDTLSKDPNSGYSPSVVVQLIDETKKKIVGKTIGEADKAAVKVLKGIKSDILKEYANENISQADLKSILQKLDKNIDYDTPLSDVSNRALKDLRHNADAMLKADNEAYGQAIAPVQRLIKIKEKAQKILGVKKLVGEYVVPNNAPSKLAALEKHYKEIDIDNLESFADITGLDIPAEAKNYAIKSHFEKATTHGARRAVVGGIVGAGIGHATGSPATGATIGTAIGAGLDIYGGKVLGRAIDTSAPVLDIIDKATPISGKASAGAIVLRGIKKEQEDHPQLSDSEARLIAEQELAKDPKFYDKE